MANWNNGYFVDFEYVDSYFTQLNPLLINLNLTFAGIDVGSENEIAVNDGFNYLELGFGRGVSLCSHALAYDGSFFMGTDFNPSHALNASNLIKDRNVIKDKNVNIEIYDDSFAELFNRLQKRDIKFDYIVLHGIWSWVNYDNQKIILKIIDSFLKVGGVVYISYNCFPGWDGKWSSRKLLTMYHDYSEGTEEEKIFKSLDFFKNFLDTKPAYLQNNPISASIMDILKNNDYKYVAHEFFNETSTCCYFIDMAKDLESCKLQFISSANPLWHFEDSELSEQSRDFIHSIKDSVMREQLKDYCFNRQFRNDLFVKGKVSLSSSQIFNKFLNTKFVLTSIPNIDSKDIGEMRTKLIKFFADDNYRPKRAREAHEVVNHISISGLATLFSDMVVSGYLHPVRNNISDSIIQKSFNFNQYIFRQQSQKQFCNYASAPLIGGAVFIDDVSQLFLHGKIEGVSDNNLVEFVWNILKSQNKSLKKENKNLEGEKENKKELENMVSDFIKKIPLYEQLGVTRFHSIFAKRY